MRRLLPLVIFSFLATFSLFPEVSIRLEPDPYFVETGKTGDPWSIEMFIEVSLRASGVSAGDVPRYSSRMFQLAEEAAGALEGVSGDYEKGEALLGFLHERLFRTYDLHQTRMDILMDTGGFNCVSSGLVYMIFARICGLNVYPIYAVDHAFCYLRSGDSSWDVETTNPWGFDPGSKKEFTDSFTGRTGYSYVPPREYSRRIPISDREMIGFIFQNRIASLQRTGRHGETIPLALDRWALTGSDMGRRDFLSTVRNTAAGYNNSGHYEQGMEMLLKIDSIYEVLKEPSIREVFEAMAFNGLIRLLNSGMINEAEQHYREVEQTGIIGADKLKEFRNYLEKKKIDLLVKTGQPDEILPAVDRIYREGIVDGNYRYQVILFVWSREAERVLAEGDFPAARKFIDAFPEDLKNRPDYQRLKETYRHNHAVTVHNEFAKLYNEGEYEKARKLLSASFPDLSDDPLLVKDRDLLRKRGFWD